jgi:hypothetical protein
MSSDCESSYDAIRIYERVEKNGLYLRVSSFGH